MSVSSSDYVGLLLVGHGTLTHAIRQAHASL